jgi:2-methylisocitrate lyase-like PEP mutase family enzyme
MEGRNSPASSTCLLGAIHPDTLNLSAAIDEKMASSDLAAQAAKLASLHIPGRPLVLTNVWDAATAKIAAAHPACAALATASFAVAASAGVEDDDLTLEQNLAAVDGIAAVARNYGQPLTVDMQSGYGDRLEEAVKRLVEKGVVGCNLEDKDTATGKMYHIDEAARRVQQVIGTAQGLGLSHFVVNARTDVLVAGGTVEEAVERGRAYLDAGATTVFVWGGSKRGGMTREEVTHVTQALGGRVSVKLCLGEQYLTVKDLAGIGVARISCGPELWWKATRAFEQEMNQILIHTG